MDIVELKERILKNTLDNKVLIFKYSDNKFIAKEYVKAICDNLKLTLNLLTSEDELFDVLNDSFGYYSSFLNLLDVEEFTVEINSRLRNCIILCNKINKDILEKVKNYVVEFPKLENWQIEDYARVKLSGLSEQEYKWICHITGYDIYRLDNEINKISIFQKNKQQQIFKSLVEDGCYSDLTDFNIFSLINSIMKRNVKDLTKILNDLRLIDIEPIGLVTLLLKQFKNVIDIQTNSQATYQTLGVTQKQFNAIKYNCGKYNTQELIDKYELLLSIDSKLKTGELESDLIIDYVICNIVR